jgi:hypothetical protein
MVSLSALLVLAVLAGQTVGFAQLPKGEEGARSSRSGGGTPARMTYSTFQAPRGAGCKASGKCVCSSNYDDKCEKKVRQEYGNNEECTITMSDPPANSMLSAMCTAFDTEDGYDELYVNGVLFQGNDVVLEGKVDITWKSDWLITKSGWVVCMTAAPCPVGEYREEAGGACVAPCPQGKYKTADGKCVAPCPEGEYKTADGSCAPSTSCVFDASVPSVRLAGVRFDGAELSLDEITNIEGSLNVDNNYALRKLSMKKLQKVGGDVIVKQATWSPGDSYDYYADSDEVDEIPFYLSMDELTNVGSDGAGDLIVNIRGKLPEFFMPNLKTVAGTIDVKTTQGTCGGSGKTATAAEIACVKALSLDHDPCVVCGEACQFGDACSVAAMWAAMYDDMPDPCDDCFDACLASDACA